MCNLSSFIEQRGIQIGLNKGRSEGFNLGKSEGIDIGINQKTTKVVLNLFKKEYSIKFISDTVEISEDEVLKIIHDHNELSV